MCTYKFRGWKYNSCGGEETNVSPLISYRGTYFYPSVGARNIHPPIGIYLSKGDIGIFGYPRAPASFVAYLAYLAITC